MTLKRIVFDCDGVLLDSVPVKTRAFARLAEPYGAEARDRFVMYHTVHGGVSRFRKFAWFFKEILNREITPRESDEWGKKFTEYALDEVRRCAMIPGALEVLQTWRGKIPLYVCSGTPTEELRMVLEERQLAGFFTGIFGSPPSKAEVLEHIVSLSPHICPDEALMVGDSVTDEDAAGKAGTLFYAVGPELKGSRCPWSQDLVHLNAWIKARAEEK